MTPTPNKYRDPSLAAAFRSVPLTSKDRHIATVLEQGQLASTSQFQVRPFDAQAAQVLPRHRDFPHVEYVYNAVSTVHISDEVLSDAHAWAELKDAPEWSEIPIDLPTESILHVGTGTPSNHSSLLTSATIGTCEIENALVDTGAEVTVMSLDQFQKVKLPCVANRVLPKLLPPNLATATGSTIFVHRALYLEITIAGTTIIHPVIIADIERDLIIGADVLMKLHAKIDLDSMILATEKAAQPINRVKTPMPSNTIHVVSANPSVVEGPECGWTIPDNIAHVELRQVIQKFANQGIFAANSKAPPHTPQVEHRIYVHGRPIRTRNKQWSPAEKEVIAKEVELMLKNRIIRPSNSEWAFQPVLVPKSDGTLRFCINFTPLNSITYLDSYPLPRIDDIFARIKNARVFTTLDLASGYWQVPMREEDKAKTAFATPNGLFEFEVMPFGLCNAPATFQRMIDNVLKDCLNKFAAGYIDDILIYSNSMEEHVQHVVYVLERLQQGGLSLKAGKCHFGAKKVKFLGHQISGEGITTDGEKIKAVREFPIPTQPSNVLSFLGLAGYYRRFIPNFAAIAAPLYNLTKADTPWRWETAEQSSFAMLKDALTTAPILVAPNYDEPFIIETDASCVGIGAVISQSHGVIEYASRSLLPAEKRYFTTELEYLAVVWALQKFHHYVYGARCELRTDHQAIARVHNRTKPAKLTGANGRIERWIMEVERYRPYLTIVARKGSANSNADALSRNPLPQSSSDTHPHTKPHDDDDPDSGYVQIAFVGHPTLAEALGEEDEEPPEASSDEEVEEELNLEIPPPIPDPQLMPNDDQESADQPPVVVQRNAVRRDTEAADLWLRLQEHTDEDKYLAPIKRYLTDSTLPEDKKEAQSILLDSTAFNVHDGVLFRMTQDGPRIAVPACMRIDVITLSHATPIGGHLGVHKTQRRIAERFYWPGMWNQIAQAVASCHVCQLNKRRYTRIPGLLQTIPAAHQPFHTIAMDIIVLRRYKTTRGYLAVLVIGDYCTRFVELYPLLSEDADEVATCLLAYLCRYGAASNLLTDRGKNFMGHVIQAINAIFGIHKLNTSPYHPQCDGLIERINQVVELILRAYVAAHPLTWDLWLNLVKFAYNTSYQESIKTSPFEALYGFRATYPYEAALMSVIPPDLQAQWSRIQRDNFIEMKRELSNAWSAIQDNLHEAHRRQADQYNTHHAAIEFNLGDNVLLNITPAKKKFKKLTFDWHGPYYIIAKLSPLVYKLAPAAPGVNSNIVQSPISISRLKPYHLLPATLREEIEAANIAVDAYDEDLMLPLDTSNHAALQQ